MQRSNSITLLVVVLCGLYSVSSIAALSAVAVKSSVGATTAIASTDRVTPSRTGHTSTKLPTHPTILWSQKAATGIEFPPVVDERGNMYLTTTSGELLSLASSGVTRWRVKLGAAPVSSPVITNQNIIAVSVGSGHVDGFDLQGNRVFRSNVSAHTLLPLDQSGILAFGHTNNIAEIDHFGHDEKFLFMDKSPMAVFFSSGNFYIASSSGAVSRVSTTGETAQVGTISTSVETLRGATLFKTMLYYVFQTRSIRAMHMQGGRTFDVWTNNNANEALEPWLTVTPTGISAVSQNGMYYRISFQGQVEQRIAIDKAELGPFSKSSPPPIVDEEGRVAFVRATGRVGVMDETGKWFVANERICLVPVSIQPAGEKKFIVTCRDGTLSMFGE